MRKNSNTAQSRIKPQRTRSGKRTSGLLENINSFFDTRLRGISVFVLIVGVFFSYLLFNIGIGTSGDDSAYIMRAHAFLHNFEYPGFQGPLFPILLSFVMAISGFNLIYLKLVSFLSMAGFLFLFMYFFRHKVSSISLIVTGLLVAVNQYILTYASLTYSEAFYMLLQILLIGVFFSRFIDKNTEAISGKRIVDHLLLASCLLALALTRSIGFSAIMAVLAYFFLTRQWKDLFLATASFVLLLLAFHTLKFFLWNEAGLTFTSQGSSLLYKNYYYPNEGKEDLAGLIVRVYKNANQYLSKHFLTIIGLREFHPVLKAIPFLTVVVAGIFISSVFISFRKNKYLLFTGLLSGFFLLVSFIALQTAWDQQRLILPVIPFMVLLLLYFFENILSYPKTKAFQLFIPLLSLFLIFKTLGTAWETTVNYNYRNDPYAAYTPDWMHYTQASKWVGENLADDERAACRKPSISFIYGKGHDFFGIYRMPSYNIGFFMDYWRNSEDQFFIIDRNKIWNAPLTLEQMKFALTQTFAFFTTSDDMLLAIKTTHEDNSEELIAMLDDFNIEYLNSREAFSRDILDAGGLVSIYYPDSMLFILKENKVTHLLTASLRSNPYIDDGATISTVEHFAAIVNEKYPMIFREVIKFGQNEPAAVYSIEYHLYE